MTDQPFDPRALRDAFGAFMTGVTVVTAHDADGRPIGFTANSFASVSLSPPLLLVCVARSARSHAAVTSASGFAVNVLAEDQKDVSNTFARSVADRFASVVWGNGPHGSPIIEGAAAWFDCGLERVVEAGDHSILIGRIEAFGNSGRNGLGYTRGSYFTAVLEAQGQVVGPNLGATVSAVVERAGHVYLVEDEAGRLALPGLSIEDANRADALEAHLAAITGLSASVGFLYSVYDDRRAGRQAIVYRASIGSGEPRSGRLIRLSELPYEQLNSQQAVDILKRFSAESHLGNFGVYFGDETAGRVHPLTMGG